MLERAAYTQYVFVPSNQLENKKEGVSSNWFTIKKLYCINDLTDEF